MANFVRHETIMDFETKPRLGMGIYTPREIADILRLPYAKVSRWISAYWDGDLGEEFGRKYSWKVNGSKAVSFHTFVELYVMMQFSEAGVKPKKILEAHKVLSKELNTAFPFAMKSVLTKICTDGGKIYQDENGVIVSLDGTRQLNLEFIRGFFKKLEFGDGEMASRYWPLGRKKSVVIDPTRKFGHPILEPTNIYPETLYGLYKAGDPIPYIAAIYEVSEHQVKHAIEYCQAA